LNIDNQLVQGFFICQLWKFCGRIQIV